jgi:hypothetical protein
VIDNIPDWIRVRGYAADWAYPAWYGHGISSRSEPGRMMAR